MASVNPAPRSKLVPGNATASLILVRRIRVMTITYFVFFENYEHPAARMSETDKNGFCDIIRRTPGLLKAHVFTPANVGGPFRDDGPPPQFALQLCFASLPELEAVLAPDGHLQSLASREISSSLAGAVASQQAMTTRSFPVPVPRRETPCGAPHCSYLVHYPGHAEDFNDWLKYYLSHHPQLMKSMPGIREIEIFTRLDWCDSMPWRRVHHMQRNKLVFDSEAALARALDSPAMFDMRADFRKFPPFVGGNLHYPMITSTVVG